MAHFRENRFFEDILLLVIIFIVIESKASFTPEFDGRVIFLAIDEKYEVFLRRHLSQET